MSRTVLMRATLSKPGAVSGRRVLVRLFPFIAAVVVSSPALPAEKAIVTGAIETLYARPDATSPVDDQVILGEEVEVLEDTAGFAKVRTASGSTAWIPSDVLRRGFAPPSPSSIAAEVTSPLAHVYREPSFWKSRPLLTAPIGARLFSQQVLETEGHTWVGVLLPDGRRGYLAKDDVAFLAPDGRPGLKTPADWIALGKRFLGSPYTWGGTTPAGFDCSGLIQMILRRHGVLLKRNSFEQAFQDPQLVPVAFRELQPGDLLFFGTENKIDHEAMWIGDGLVLQATAWDVPSTQITAFEKSARLTNRFRYARRLAALAKGRAPGVTSARAKTLTAALASLARTDGATFGIVAKDLTTGVSASLNPSTIMHAASTMKTAVLLEVLRRVDAGSLKLTDELPVKNEFRSLADGSPFSVGLDPETEGPTVKHLGRTAPLGFLVSEMIVRSSNLATNVVLTLVGPEAVQKLCDELGAPTVRVRRCVEDSKAFEKGINNETDAAGMAALMEACVRSPKLSGAAKAKAWEILTGQTENAQIPAGLHPQSGAVVGHKTGSISFVQHDAAVVKLPDGRMYVLVLLANDFGANEAGQKRVIETTKKMSRAVWEAMIAP